MTTLIQTGPFAERQTEEKASYSSVGAWIDVIIVKPLLVLLGLGIGAVSGLIVALLTGLIQFRC